MHPFSTPPKTSKNRKVFWCFQEVEKGALETNGLNLPRAKAKKYYSYSV